MTWSGWAGHPNWYFRMSKFSLPFLKAFVAQNWFSTRGQDTQRLRKHVIKRCFRSPVSGDHEPDETGLASIPKEKHFAVPPAAADELRAGESKPRFGPTKAEIRIMYIWVDELQPVMMIVRMGRA